MATRRLPSLDHEEILLEIDKKLASDEFQERTSSIELILQIYRDVPKERTVDQLTGCLERLAADTKWEVRKASIRPLIELRRPGVRNTLERLAKDPNKWVRRQAEDGKKRLVRITGDNKGANFVYEATKGLGGSSAEKIFKTALEVGEKHYQEFAADIAHELNTYSAVIQGFLRELELSLGDEGLKGETEEIFAKLQERSGYLQKLVDDLVVYTRDVDLTYEWHPLEPILRDAVDIAFQKTSRSLERRSVDTRIYVQDDLSAQVCRDRFERAVTNFVSNALEAMAGEERERKLQIDARLNEVPLAGVNFGLWAWHGCCAT